MVWQRISNEYKSLHRCNFAQKIQKGNKSLCTETSVRCRNFSRHEHHHHVCLSKMYGWSWWRWVENIWWRTHWCMSSIRPIPWRKPAYSICGTPPQSSWLPARSFAPHRARTQILSLAAKTRLETASAALHSESTLGCGGCKHICAF